MASFAQMAYHESIYFSATQTALETRDGLRIFATLIIPLTYASRIWFRGYTLSIYIYVCVCTYIERDNNCSISSSPIRLELLSELNTGRTGSYEVELNITSLVYIFANGYRKRSKNRASIFAREENKKGGRREKHGGE